jgi:hypothetical protein
MIFSAAAARDLLPFELRLMLDCARPAPDEDVISAIKETLLDGIDWTSFVQAVLDHKLTGPVGQTLTRIGAEFVPQDILDAFEVRRQRTRHQNTVRFDELGRILDGLSKAGIDAIPFKGPIAAIQYYGDISLREFRDLDFLLRNEDLDRALAALQHLGYVPEHNITRAQLDLIHRLQGQEMMVRQSDGMAIEPHTRLVSIKMALNLDHAGFFSRARRVDCGGHSVLTFSPEDSLISLAIHGGKELWWRINWVCDIATFVSAQANLDWSAVLERARLQGCRRMVLLAALLAWTFFGSPVPDAVIAAAQADRRVPPMVLRIAETWRDGAEEPPSPKVISRDLFYLHDRLGAGIAYAMRTVFLPGIHHVMWLALPRSLHFAYVPLKPLHDLILLPLWKLYQAARGNQRKIRTG